MTGRPGEHTRREIAEQPEAWERLLGTGRAAVRDVAEQLAVRSPRIVLLVARGTSDHAALYAKYLVEVLLERPAGLVSPSTMTAYGARPDLRDALMIAVSQSGGSPDLVRSVEVARERGAQTLAVTNAPDSPLAHAAHLHLDVLAGPERAVAATKTYTAQLLALFLLVDALRGGDGTAADALPAHGRRLLEGDEQLAALAQRYRFAQRLITTGRGFSYATASEAALKLMETSYISAQAFSGADLMHGPLAMVDSQVPVLAVVADGHGGRAMLPVVEQLAAARADVLCVGTSDAVARATVGIELPTGVPEELSPVLEIVPFQQLALHLALARGADPDAPRGLNKVTETV